MKVLITGATGFIGNYVIKELLKIKDCKIIATSLLSVDKAKDFDWYDQVIYKCQDLNDSKNDYFSFFEKPNLLIHLAWQGLPNYTELFHFEKNLFLNYKFIKNLIENGLKDLSVIGTCLEYGMKSGCLSEDCLTNPVTSYGLAKDTLRKFLEQYNNLYSFNFKWIRLFYLYGEGQNPKSLLSQLDKALDNGEDVFNMSGGEQLRDYLPVEKAAEYIVKISLQDEINGRINCCSGKPISIRHLVENHIKRRKKKINLNLGFYPYLDYEPFAFWGDNKKLDKILNDTKKRGLQNII
ncbi:MAG: NAD-dependent epimerase/dehydratase family protein [Promethearchaeota archaeon]